MASQGTSVSDLSRWSAYARVKVGASRAYGWCDSAVAILAFWLVSRATVIFLIERPRFIPALHAITVSPGDVEFYKGWSTIVGHGAYPAHDLRWQYPPLAALVMAAPRLLSFMSYQHAFEVLALLVDLIGVILLLRKGERRAGAWVWNLGLPLLGTIVYLRYDLFVTLPAVAALLMLPRERLFGGLAAVGAMLKVWPVLLLLSLPRDRRLVSGVIAFAGTAVALLLGSRLIGHNELSFLHGQSNRGMEVEAVAVAPWQLGRAFGLNVKVRYAYGCLQFASPYMNAVATLCMAATLIGFALVAFLAWRRRPATWSPAFACDLALTITMVSITTSRVLSPQYLIWAIGLAAACMAFKGSQQRLSVALILIAALLTQAVFPFAFDGFLRGHTFISFVLVTRNMLLLVATVSAIKSLWRRPVTPAEPSVESQQAEALPNIDVIAR